MSVEKYQKHKERQYAFILSTAKRMITEKGIDGVSFGALAQACNITRATLYRYFKDKEALLWGIQHKIMHEMGEKLRKQSAEQHLTALERFALYFEELFQGYQYHPDNLLFFDVFRNTYQNETVKGNSEIYNKTFRPGDFGSKDTVEFLLENFHDGSLLKELDPELVAVSAVYSAIYLLADFRKSSIPISLKYQIKPAEAAQLMLTSFLKNISADGLLPKSWERFIAEANHILPDTLSK